MKAVRILITLLLVILLFDLYSQKKMDEIELQKIHQKKIREFIVRQKNNSVICLQDLKASFGENEDTTKYQTVNKMYLIKENLVNVWERYLTNDLSRSWNGNIVSFGASYSRKTQLFSYGIENYIKADTGQIMFLNLRLLKGIYNLAVAFEITDIDPIKKIIVFNYIEGGKSRGEQILQFRSTEDGYTEIEHKAYFKSNSKFRDKRLYPFFHIKAIDEFHENMLKACIQVANAGIPES